MEPETSTIVQEDIENDYVTVEESKGQDAAEKFEEGEMIVDNNTVINVMENQPTAVMNEPVYPDVTRFSYDVQHGYRIFRELLSDQYKSITRPFFQPVDVDGLGLWDYYTRIETPMSFKQIESKFMNYLYQSITEIVSDMRLILENCYRYNGSDHWISKLAQKLENILDQKLALLNRSIRHKVTLRATMAFRDNKEIMPEIEELGVCRRRSGRSSYLDNVNNEQTSRLVNHLILEEEKAQKEMRILKEKEKREANEVLMQELNEWENEIFTPDVLKELHSMWEIPSIGCFLWLFRESLNLPELNFTEFENGFVIPHKSKQMANIFSVLLITPNQRKSFHKKSPMKFEVWEKKLKERMDLWYMTHEAEEYQMVAQQIGLDRAFFEILGSTNPLEKKSYLDLSLHQRVLILKSLCDECLDYDPQLRDNLGNIETTQFREIVLGNDGENCSYIYFPIFDASDIRIYQQSPLPSPSEWYRKWTTASKTVTARSKSGRSSQSKSRKSSSKRSKELGTSIEEGFQLVCSDVETLRELCEKFSGRTTTLSGKRRRGRPTRKRSEEELHDVLTSLLKELGPSEGKFVKARIRGMLNLMKEWKTVEEINDSVEESIVQDHDNMEETPGEYEANSMITEPALAGGRSNTDHAKTTGNNDVSTNVPSPGVGSEKYFVNSDEHASLSSSRITRSKQNTRKRMPCADEENSTCFSKTNIYSENNEDIQSEVLRVKSNSEKLDTTMEILPKDSQTVLSPKIDPVSENDACDSVDSEVLRTNSISEKLATTMEVLPKDSETVLSPKIDPVSENDACDSVDSEVLRTNSISEKLATTMEVLPKDSETVLSPKIDPVSENDACDSVESEVLRTNSNSEKLATTMEVLPKDSQTVSPKIDQVSHNNETCDGVQSEVLRTNSISEKLEVLANDSETVLSPKITPGTENNDDIQREVPITDSMSENEKIIWLEEAEKELLPEKVAASKNSEMAGNKQDYGGSEDTCGVVGSSETNKSDICTEYTKGNPLKSTSDENKEHDLQNRDGYMRTHGILEDHSINNIVHDGDSDDKQGQLSEVTSIKSCCKMENSVDISDNEEPRGTFVYQNGDCSKLEDICNGAQSDDNYEPSNKRHCSAENHIPISIPTGNKFDGVSLETSHQSLVKIAVNNDVQNRVTALKLTSAKSLKTTAGNDLDGVSLETSHQSPVKRTVNDDVQNHVTNLTNSIG